MTVSSSKYPFFVFPFFVLGKAQYMSLGCLGVKKT